MEAVIESTKAWFEQRNQAWLNGKLEPLYAHGGCQPAIVEMARRRVLLAQRKAFERKVICDIQITVLPTEALRGNDGIRVHVKERLRFLYEMNDRVEHEQRQLSHQMLWSPEGSQPLLEHGHLVEGTDPWQIGVGDASLLPESLEQWRVDRFRGAYQRLSALRYAEQWWNSHNPQYANMGVDCTNFVSQVMHAGGLPMVGGNRRDAGWWYHSAREKWSYSWAVATSLAAFLSNPRNPFGARIVQKPEELTIGDVIAYDWTHSGRYGHNTVVVGHDAAGQPLVDAHTVDSHQRFWSYEDSYAWTPNTQYLLIHFPD